MKSLAVTADANLPPTPPPTNLAGRSLGALKWNYIGALTRIVSQLAIGILLARLLGPEPYGLIAVAWLIVGLGNLVADTGMGVALIQKEQISTRDIRYVFTLQMLAGLTLTLITLIAAPWISAFFDHPEASNVLRWMSLLFIIQAFGQTSTALLRRSLDHKRMQMLQVGSYLTGYLLLGIPLALYGMGVWALVIGQLAQSGLYAIAVYANARHPLTPAFTAEQPGLFKFGSKVLGSNLTSWGISNLDSAIIGRLLGILELGLYNRSMNLLASPMNAAVSTLQGVLLPMYSRLQNRPDDVRDTYLATMCLLLIALAPAFAAIAAMPETTVLAVFGQEWRAAAVLIAPLALAMPVNAMLAMGGPMMQGMGRVGMEAASQGIGLIVMVIVVVVAASYSLAAVAWAVLAIYLLRALLVTRLAAGLVAAPASAFIRVLLGPLVLAALAGLLTWQADLLLSEILPQPALRFVLALSFSAIITMLTILAAGRWLFCTEAKKLLLNAQPHLGSHLGKLVTHWSKT
jgi:PST family polysaccharide transporter